MLQKLNKPIQIFEVDDVNAGPLSPPPVVPELAVEPKAQEPQQPPSGGFFQHFDGWFWGTKCYLLMIRRNASLNKIGFYMFLHVFTENSLWTWNWCCAIGCWQIIPPGRVLHWNVSFFAMGLQPPLFNQNHQATYLNYPSLVHRYRKHFGDIIGSTHWQSQLTASCLGQVHTQLIDAQQQPVIHNATPKISVANHIVGETTTKVKRDFSTLLAVKPLGKTRLLSSKPCVLEPLNRKKVFGLQVPPGSYEAAGLLWASCSSCSSWSDCNCVKQLGHCMSLPPSAWQGHFHCGDWTKQKLRA